MRVLSLIAFLAFVVSASHAQELDPIKWEVKAKEQEEGLYEISMTATMDEGWHLYATYLPSDEGPFPTVFKFGDTRNFETIGDLEFPTPVTKYDENFMMDLNFYDERVTFIQKVKASSDAAPAFAGEVEYMCCNDEMCLPPKTVPLFVSLGK